MLNREQVATLIRARRISKEEGLEPDAGVTAICKHAGVSRKTGYQWAQKHGGPDYENEPILKKKLQELRIKNEALEKSYDDLRFENEGRKLAWRIHGGDEFLALKKKPTTKPRKKKKR